MLFNKIKLQIYCFLGSKSKGGFSLVEVVFAVSIFSIVAVSIYQGFLAITNLVSVSRDKVAAVDLINSEFELVRNLSFSNVGLQAGIPQGVLSATSTVIKDGRQFVVTRIVRNIDDPFDGVIGGSPNDLSPADYKMVQINVNCQTCKKPVTFSSYANVAPKNLETASTNGALFVRVFDANGDPVPQAEVSVTNSAFNININETTNNDGVLQIVDAPPAANSYRIVVNKSGYTQDRTYATSTENPNPVKLDATVLLQQLTQISFVIDKSSNLNMRTIDNFCAPVASVPFSVNGTKLIGTSPDVYKWIGDFTTDLSGIKEISGVEWDTYSFQTSGGFYLAGTNPITPLTLLPDSNQNLDLVIESGNPNILLVRVKDGVTGLPISGASVSLSSATYNENKITDQGFFRQTDWSGGSGQLNFFDSSKYHSSDSNVETNNPVGDLKLFNSLGLYSVYGEMTSSIFDAGAAANWSKVDILPTDQPVETGINSVRFQIATAAENTATTTWNFLGPDGTSLTFYSIQDNNINPIHDGDRFIRYKIFLTTADTAFSPNVSDFIISFSSSCIPPGQASFSNLVDDIYELEVSATGYGTQNITNVSVFSNWQDLDVLLFP